MAKSFKKITEEIANAIGGGAIAGAGVPLEGKPDNWGEPGVSPVNQKKHQKRARKTMLRRKLPEVIGTE